MNRIATKLASLLASMIIALTLTASPQAVAQQVNEKPTPSAMVADALVARPLLLVTSVLSTGLYVAFLPAILAGGNTQETGQALVLEPWKNTVLRCLGCKHAGRSG